MIYKEWQYMNIKNKKPKKEKPSDTDKEKNSEIDTEKESTK